MSSFRLVFVAILALSSLICVRSLDNGLALTPPMGWMAWQRYRCNIDCESYPDECISDKLFRRMADRMVEDGYKDVGYEYIIIDDCWMEKERDANGKLVADRKRFPFGIKDLSDYVHAKGLKFGIYQDFGTHTCAGYPGIIGHMKTDAQTFAEWEVDYVKLDGCNSRLIDMDRGYPAFGHMLNQTGRPMVYSCSWPVYQELSGMKVKYDLLKKHCNLWRNWYDIDDSWESVRYVTKYFAEKADRIQPHAGPGHWNDPDMLVIGNFGLSYEQSKAQMAIWAILAAPLIMSNNLEDIRPEIQNILKNRAIIEVNQDPLGIQGTRKRYDDMIEIWTRPIVPVVNNFSAYAVAIVSHRTDGSPFVTKLKLDDIGLEFVNGYKQIDLFNSANVVENVRPKEEITIRVNPTGVEFFKFIPNIMNAKDEPKIFETYELPAPV